MLETFCDVIGPKSHAPPTSRPCDRLTYRWLGCGAADSLARMSPLQAAALGSPGPARGSGGRGPASYAKFDHQSLCWRTSQGSLLGAPSTFSGSLPRRGTMRSGRLSERATWGQITAAKESSSSPTLPTLSARDWRSGKASPETHHRNARPLSEVVGRENNGGHLNPTWAEWFMGFPLGFVNPGSDASATPSSLKPRMS